MDEYGEMIYDLACLMHAMVLSSSHHEDFGSCRNYVCQSMRERLRQLEQQAIEDARQLVFDRLLHAQRRPLSDTGSEAAGKDSTDA